MTRLLCALLFGLAAPAYAQQSLGTLATLCGGLDANRELAIDTTLALPARAVVVASIAGRGDVLADLSIVDPGASSFSAIGAQRARTTVKLRVAQLAALAGAALPAGSRFTLRSGSAEPGTPVCVVLHAFADVAVGASALQSRAADSGSSAALSLTGGASGDATPQLLLAAFALSADPGGFTAVPPATATSVCAAGGTLCLGTLSSTDPGTGLLTLGATLGASVTWSGALASLDRDTMLKDGFE